MNVRMRIGRVVFDGIDVAVADRARVKAAIESQLARLVAEHGIAPDLARGIAVPSITAPQIGVAPDARPAQLGGAIASSVLGGVGGRR